MQFKSLVIALLLGCSTLPAHPILAQSSNHASNQLVSHGSDTLSNLMQFWAKQYEQRHPHVKVNIHSEGSHSAVDSLLAQQTDLGPMSRLMTKSERQEFKNKFGYTPTPITVAKDTLAIFVNRDNPLESVSIAQLAAIFSSSSHCGKHSSIEKWGQLELQDQWKYKTIEIVGRNSLSGTHNFFKQQVMCNGEFRANLLEQPGSTSLVQYISHSPYAIGFSGYGYKTSGVKALSIKDRDGRVTTPLDTFNERSSYPLTRHLYIYVMLHPEQKSAEKIANFFKLIFSEQGSNITIQDGYIPLTQQEQKQQLSKLRFF